MLMTLKSNAPGATELTLINGNTETNKRLLAAGNFGDAVWQHRFAGARGTQGSRPAQGVPQNRGISFQFRVHGSTKDDLATKLSELYEAMDEVRRFGGRLKWQANQQTYRQYFELLATDGAQLEEYGKRGESINRAVLTLSAQCAPYLSGDSMTVFDDFAVDSIADYTFDAGGGTLSVSGGQLVPSSTVQKVIRHTGRGYSYGDTQGTWKFTTGASVAATWETRVIVKATAVDNYVFAGVGDNNFLEIYVRTAASNSFKTSAATAAFAASTTYWVRTRIEGNVVTAELFTSVPTPMATPTTTVSHTLSGADATNFGSGVVGQAGGILTPKGTDWRYDDFVVEPFTYRNLTLPEYIRLNGAIPGDAPALCDVTVTPSGGAAASVFALLGWSERPLTHNLVWNGDFEDTGTDGWAASADDNVSAATSISRILSPQAVGTAGLGIVCPATANSGASFRIYRRFKKGVTYTLKCGIWSGGDTTLVGAVLGRTGDFGVTVDTALTTTRQTLTMTWTPAADQDYAVVGARIRAATATTWRIDGVQVYEGTTAPTLGRHAEGGGAMPPFGIIEAEACDTGDLTGWAIAADAGSRSGFRLIDTTATDGETYLATWFVDPNLLAPDEYTQGDLHVEVWARVYMASTLVTPKLTLSARSSRGASFGSERFSFEYGSNGKLLTLPSSGTVARFMRLGTVPLVVDRARAQTWKLAVAGDVSAGSSGNWGLDYLDVCPVRQRALSPTGEPNDASYPDFVASTSETVKLIRSDLSGAILTTSATGTTHPDHGLGGSLLELPNGDVDVLVKLSSLVPDDPTVDGTSEQLAHNATVGVSVTPRYHFLRPV